MNEFKIDKDVPMPPHKRENIYPWADMEVADSFYVPIDDQGIDKLQNAMISISKYQQRKRGTKYATRREGEGVRVWRTA